MSLVGYKTWLRGCFVSNPDWVHLGTKWKRRNGGMVGGAQKKLDPIVDPLQRRSVETRQRWQRVALRFEREVSVATLSVSFSVGVI